MVLFFFLVRLFCREIFPRDVCSLLQRLRARTAARSANYRVKPARVPSTNGYRFFFFTGNQKGNQSVAGEKKKSVRPGLNVLFFCFIGFNRKSVTITIIRFRWNELSRKTVGSIEMFQKPPCGYFENFIRVNTRRIMLDGISSVLAIIFFFFKPENRFQRNSFPSDRIHGFPTSFFF